MRTGLKTQSLTRLEPSLGKFFFLFICLFIYLFILFICLFIVSQHSNSIINNADNVDNDHHDEDCGWDTTVLSFW